MADPLQYIQKDFSGGMNQQVDPTRIGPNEYPLGINLRNRYSVIETINQPVQETSLPPGIIQGLYAAGAFAIAFVNGKAYYRDYSTPGTQFIRVDPFQLSPDAPVVFAELVPASTLNFQRIPASDDRLSPVALTSQVSSTPQALIAQDGVSQPWIISPDGKGRPAQTYADWTVDNREYVPIGRNMLFAGGILYLVAPDGVDIYRSVSGRPMDFMVNVTSPAGDKPAPTEADGGAQTSSHRVGYEPITCLASLNSPDGGFFVSTPKNSTKVVPDFTALIWGEPQFDNSALFPTGAINQFSFVDILGDSAFVDFTGIRSFNAVLQFRYEGKNSPFSAKVFNLFKEIVQVNPCAGKFDNYAFFSVQTIYGPGVLVYDEITSSWVGLDIYPGVGAIKQFAEIKTTTFRKLLFITEDNKLYEAFAGATAPLTLYAGEFCSNDPKMEQTGMVFKVILVDAKEDGTITVTPFIDRKAQTPIPTPVTAVLPSNPVPMVVPFGVSTSDTVQSKTFEIGRVQSGWKVGMLITVDFACSISHLSLTTEAETQEVAPQEEAARYSAFAL